MNFRCQCGQGYEVGPGGAGLRFPCVRCGRPVPVPGSRRLAAGWLTLAGLAAGLVLVGAAAVSSMGAGRKALSQTVVDLTDYQPPESPRVAPAAEAGPAPAKSAPAVSPPMIEMPVPADADVGSPRARRAQTAVMRGLEGVRIVRDRKTGTSELIVDPFPEDRVRRGAVARRPAGR